MQNGTRVLGRAEAAAGPASEGTLLAIVPIPGTDTSLAIVGYPVPAAGSAPGGALAADALPAGVLAAGPLAAGAVPAAALRTALGIPGFPGLPGQSGAGQPAGPQYGGAPAGTALAGAALAGAALAGREQPGLRLDHEQRRVWADGAEIPLTFQEFELLAFLSAHPATVFSRDDLVRQVWQRDFGADSRTVDVHVSRLRHKLGPAYGRCLVTEYRVGYQFRPQ